MNFLIGMPGGFDENKFRRDFKEDFWGIEACMFPNEDEIDKLLQVVKQKKIKFGVHFPLHAGIYKLRDPLLLSLDETEREEAFKVFENEAEYSKGKGAEYILVHFPKPVIINKSLDWSCWRFADSMEWMYQSDYSFDCFEKKCEYMFKRLSDISLRLNIQIVLEHDALSEYLYKTNILETLLKKYPRIKMCIDTGRLHLFEKVDKQFDSKEFVSNMAEFTYLVHIWNVRTDNNVTGGHYPVLPSLKVEDGWADIAGYLRILGRANKDVKVLFEHRSDLITDEELDECYKWVEFLLKQ